MSDREEGLEFYRCKLAGHVVSVWDIRKGGCQRCGCRQIVPADLTWYEKLIQVIKHPKVWEWPDHAL